MSETEPHVEFTLVVLARLRQTHGRVILQGFLHAALGGALDGSLRRGRQHGRENRFVRVAPPPEQAESLLEDRIVLLALDQCRMERPVEILPSQSARGFRRVNGIECRTRSDFHARRAQDARKADDLFGETQVPAAVIPLPSARSRSA
jgi:hypothetical protein